MRSVMLERRMKRKPTHPGEVLKHDILPSLGGVSQADFGKMLGLSRKTINEILAGKNPITAETAVKLGALFGNTPQSWLNMQSSYDIWTASEALEESLPKIAKWQKQMQTLSSETAINRTLTRNFD